MEETQSRWRRWRHPDLMLGIVALVAGCTGAWLSGQYLKNRVAAVEQGMARRYEVERVVVASSDLQRGQRLDGGNLAIREMPGEFAPPDALRSADASRVMGGMLAVAVARGTPISPALLTEDRDATLASVLKSTERALTLTVDELASQAGALRAGDRVDLYYARRQDRDAMLVPLLQRVEVLATGSSMTGDAEAGGFSTITVRVDVGDAPRLLLAQESGSIAVLLRAGGDDTLQAARIHRSSELLRTSPSRIDVTGVEVLTGGAGGGVPERSFLTVGAAPVRGAT